MNKRIIGLDVARAIAIVGMMMVNFKVVLGNGKPVWLADWSSIIDGKFSAIFVVLAGIGIALMSKGKVTAEAQAAVRIRIVKRAVFLFILGLMFYLIWPADILHYYGVYMLITAAVLYASPRLLIILSTVLILGYMVLVSAFDYTQAWNFKTYEYADFWTLNGFVRNLFFNGFHPVIPWVSFMLYGLWLGRQDLQDGYFVRKIFRLSGIMYLLIQVSSILILQLFSGVSAAELESIKVLFGTAPMPPTPIYMFTGITFATFIISACILVSSRFIQHRWIQALASTGRMALTIYILHVVIGIGIFEEPLMAGEEVMSLSFSLVYALSFSVLCILISTLWLKKFKSGPLEWLMRKVT